MDWVLPDLPGAAFGRLHLLTRVLNGLLIALVLAGCGQKGPLILPPPEGAEQPQSPTEDKAKDKDKVKK